MNLRGARITSLFAAALVLSAATVACSSAEAPTPIVLVQTPTPAPSDVATDTPAATSTPAATASPSASAGASASTAPTPTPAPASSASPGAPQSPSPASMCLGTATNVPFFVQVANKLKIDFYCGRMGKGWSFTGGTWSSSKGGVKVTMTYKGPSGAFVQIDEGSFCTTSAAVCSPNTGNLGSANFGPLTGDLDTTVDGFAIYVDPGTGHAYQVTSKKVSRAMMEAIGTAMLLVAKV